MTRMMANLTVAAGLGLATGLSIVALARRDRPLHAYGSTHPAVLRIAGGARLGVPLLDEPGEHAGVARLSRAASLARRGPDVAGLALRVNVGTRRQELLFASTGRGLLGRYLLRLTTHPERAFMTTLLPSDSPSGPVQLSLSPSSPGRWRIAWSRPHRRRWTDLGELEVALHQVAPEPGHFNPVANLPTGLTTPAWVRRLRNPAYAAARALVRIPGPGSGAA